jgi:hypothetical protein
MGVALSFDALKNDYDGSVDMIISTTLLIGYFFNRNET